MQRALSILVAGMFLCSSIFARAQQTSSVPGLAGNQSSPNPTQDCSGYFDAASEATRAEQRDRRMLVAQSDSTGAVQMNGVSAMAVDLQHDLTIVNEKVAVLNKCTLGRDGLNAPQAPPAGCSNEQLLRFQMNHEGEEEREIPILRVPGDTAFFYEAGMTIDADGAPNAYHPDNIGLDDLSNAGSPGYWYGLAKNADGEPFVQGPNDPFPGYYVSATALADRTKAVNDPTRYVDASKIPFIVLPGAMAREIGARPGDFAVVFNQRNGQSSFAIFGDVGPSDRIGEGSVALAENLGIRSDARNGGARRGILFLVFPGSGNDRPRPIEEINSESEKLLQAWGGSSRLAACVIQGPARPFAGNQNTN
jgi:Fungal chitosanase of glycosyl hydrolase group 75